MAETSEKDLERKNVTFYNPDEVLDDVFLKRLSDISTDGRDKKRAKDVF